MPVRSLNKSVLKWPDRDQVLADARSWALATATRRTDVERIGLWGSCARGDWGPGNDVDILVIVRSSDQPFIERPRDFDATRLPVPADVSVYTELEINNLSPDSRLARTLQQEVLWLYKRPP